MRGTPITMIRPMRNSGSVRNPPVVAVTVSEEKVRRDRAKSMKSIISASPVNPAEAPSSPFTGEMPEVAMTDIAWQSATIDRSPLIISRTQRTTVSIT